MTPLFFMVVAAAVGWVIVTAGVGPIERLCRRRNLLDHPGPRKIHSTPVPRLTGIAIFAALWGTILLAWVVVPEYFIEVRAHAGAIAGGAILVLVLGVIDDIRPLGGWQKLVGELAAGVPLWFSGVGFTKLWIPFVGGVDLGVLSLPVTMIWFLLLLNAINIIDGIDGLATATASVATLTLIWIGWGLNLAFVWIAAAGLFGALAGFWRYNRPPAKVFMGDSGSLTLGYFFAVVALIVPIKRFTALAFFVPLIAMLLPLAESVLSAGRRSLSGASPMRADAGHLHHLLLAAGWSPRRIVTAYAVVTAIFGGFCVALTYGNRRLLTVILAFFVLSLGVGLGIIFRRMMSDRGGQPLGRSDDEG